MTMPRRHIAGQVSMITRRISERRYFLRPDDYINQVLHFEVAKAANKHGQQIYAAMAMSNHVHMAVGDLTAKRSKFMQDAMSGIARSRNRDLGRKGHFWESGSYNDTVLLDRDAIERKLLYIWLNPVRAGLVERAEEWPGFKILPKHWGKTVTIKKPERFYGRRTPEEVEFTPLPPPGFEDMELEEVREYFQKRLKEEEDKLIKRRENAKISFCGSTFVLAQDPMDSPKEEELASRFIPRFATKDAELRAAAQDIYRGFCETYESCRERWLKNRGKSIRKRKRVKFPAGTVQLRQCAPISCKDVADDEPGILATG